MKKYKIVYSTNQVFQDIEIPFDFSKDSIGDNVSLLDTVFNITQIGSVVQCVNKNWVLTLQEIPEINSED